MKLTLWLFLIWLGCASAFFGHAGATGVGIPYQDPTPAQAAYEQFHRPISSILFGATALSFVVFAIAALIAVPAWLIGRLRRP